MTPNLQLGVNASYSIIQSIRINKWPQIEIIESFFLSDINDDYVHTCHAVTEHVIAQAMAVI